MRTIGRTIATVKLGVHQTYDNCCYSFKKNFIKVSPWAEDLLKKTPLSQTPTDIELVEVTVGELGFDKATPFDAICRRIVERGFDLCPAEAAVMLRDSYNNQRKDEWLIVAMETLTDSDGVPSVFRLGRLDRDYWLRTYCGRHNQFFIVESRFVVARRKQT